MIRSIEPAVVRRISPDRSSLALVAAAQLVSWTGLQLAPTLGGPLIVRISGQDVLAGFPLALAYGASGLSAAFGVRMARRVGAAHALAAGAALGAFGTALAALAEPMHSPAVMLAGITIEGFGLGWCWLSRYLAASLLGPGQAHRALGLVVGSAAIGAVAGPLTIPGLEDLSARLGMATSVLPWLLATMLFAVLFTWSFGVRLDALPEAPPAGHAPERSSVARTSPIVGGAWARAVLQAAMTAMMSSVPVIVSRQVAQNWIVPVMMSGHFFGMFALAPLFAPLIPARRAPGATIGACALMAAALVTLAAADSVPARALAMFAVGLAWSLVYLALSIWIGTVPEPDGRRWLEGHADLLGQAGGAVGAFIAGFGLAYAGFAKLSLAFAAGSLAVAVLVCVQLRWSAGGHRGNETTA